MNDDITRIAEKWTNNASQQYGTPLNIHFVDALTELDKLRDEETARLNNAHESELEKGEARYVELAESLESTREMLEEVNSHNEKTQEENLELAAEVIQLRARLAEATAEIASLKFSLSEQGITDLSQSRDNLVIEIRRMGGTAIDQSSRILALESQCQRMRDALTTIAFVKCAVGSPDELWTAKRTASDAISSPLDLELLNRVRDVLNQVLSSAFPNKKEQPAMHAAWLSVDQLLKSLSPAP